MVVKDFECKNVIRSALRLLLGSGQERSVCVCVCVCLRSRVYACVCARIHVCMRACVRSKIKTFLIILILDLTIFA